MKNIIKYFAFTICIIIQTNLNAQDALSVTVNCSSHYINLVISDGFTPYTVEWQEEVNGNFVTMNGWPKYDITSTGGAGPEDLFNVGNGNYKVIVEDELCGIAELEVFVDCPCDYQLVLDEIQHIVCDNTTGLIDVSVPGVSDQYVEYWWYRWDGLSWILYCPNCNSPFYSLPKGKYKVEAHVYGCIVSKVYTIIQEDDISFSYGIINPATSCTPNPFVYHGYYTSSNDGSACIDVNPSIAGNYQIVWDDDIGGWCNYFLSAGTHTVKLLFPDGCEVELGEVEICCCENTTENPNHPDVPFCSDTEDGNPADIEIIDADVIGSTGQDDGSIQVYVTPGTTVEYSWSENGMGNNSYVSGLSPGTYCVTVSHICGGFEDSGCFDIVDCSVQNLNVSGQVTNTCEGYSVGSINTTVTGGVSPYQYLWSNGSTSSSVNNLSQGQFCVTITDKNGCSISDCYQIGFNSLVRMGCSFLCNDDVVLELDTYFVYDQDNCSYIHWYCTDGYYLGYEFVGLLDVNVDVSCTLTATCYNGEILGQVIGNLCRDCIIFQDGDDIVCCHVDYCYFPELDLSYVQSIQEHQSVVTIQWGRGLCNIQVTDDCQPGSPLIYNESVECNNLPFNEGNCYSYFQPGSFLDGNPFGFCSGNPEPLIDILDSTKTMAILNSINPINFNYNDSLLGSTEEKYSKKTINVQFNPNESSLILNFDSKSESNALINILDKNLNSIFKFQYDPIIGMNNISIKEKFYQNDTIFVKIDQANETYWSLFNFENNITNESLFEGRIKVYPIPTGNILFIDFSNTFIKSTPKYLNLIIRNKLGQIKLRKRYESIYYENKLIELDITHLPDDVYLLELSDNEFFHWNEKIIKLSK